MHPTIVRVPSNQFVTTPTVECKLFRSPPRLRHPDTAHRQPSIPPESCPVLEKAASFSGYVIHILHIVCLATTNELHNDIKHMLPDAN